MLVSRGRPLLGNCRTRAALVLVACAVTVGTLGLVFAGQTGPDGFDNAIDSPAVTLLGRHQTLLLWLIAPGDLIPAIAFGAAPPGSS